jgi:hypothetical protein
MKLIKTCVVIAGMVCLSLSSFAQRIRIKEGDLSPLKGEKSINAEFTYEDLKVGKFNNEQDYINKKTEEYNKKEAGKGDHWAKEWVADRKNRFEPKFIELFEKYSDMTVSTAKKEAKYTMIYKTTTMEPGFNVGVMRKNAEIDAEFWILETSSQKVICKISVDNAKGRDFWGADFDTGARLAECYADAGKALGKFVKDKAN